METVYPIATKKDSNALTEVVTKNDRVLFPMVEFLKRRQSAVDEFIDAASRARLEVTREVSAMVFRSPIAT